MAPKTTTEYCSRGDDQLHLDEVAPVVTEETHGQKRPPTVIVWRNVFWMVYLHAVAVLGIYFSVWADKRTWLWEFFKQNDVIEWARDHRVHHKFSETDADPHNAKRGFFFAHMGWLLVRKHPDVKAKGKAVDMSDLFADPVLRLQRKIYLPAMIFMCFIFPAFVPCYFWGESVIISFSFASVLRYIFVLHMTWLVNSAAHMWGNKPYDHTINPSENAFVSVGAIGEGFHNYHHTFPHDYATSEYGSRLNLTTGFIDLMAMLGQVTHRKKMDSVLIKRRKGRTGDGSSGLDVLKAANIRK